MINQYNNKNYSTPQEIKNFIIGRVSNLKDTENLKRIKDFIDKSQIK